jgi:predicted DNA-binding protein (MmcQ/YjbR family)
MKNRKAKAVERAAKLGKWHALWKTLTQFPTTLRFTPCHFPLFPQPLTIRKGTFLKSKKWGHFY